jgi:hypothetical protein
LGSKTGFPLWVGEKARIRTFFFCARRFRFFCAYFSSRFRASEHESAKKAPAPTTDGKLKHIGMGLDKALVSIKSGIVGSAFF